MKLLATIALALTLIFSGITTAGATTVHVTSQCGKPYRATGDKSLRDIAAFVALSPVSQVLQDTVFCYPGQVFPPDVTAYINQGNFNAPMTQGSRLWFSRLEVRK